MGRSAHRRHAIQQAQDPGELDPSPFRALAKSLGATVYLSFESVNADVSPEPWSSMTFLDGGNVAPNTDLLGCTGRFSPTATGLGAGYYTDATDLAVYGTGADRTWLAAWRYDTTIGGGGNTRRGLSPGSDQNWNPASNQDGSFGYMAGAVAGITDFQIVPYTAPGVAGTKAVLSAPSNGDAILTMLTFRSSDGQCIARGEGASSAQQSSTVTRGGATGDAFHHPYFGTDSGVDPDIFPKATLHAFGVFPSVLSASDFNDFAAIIGI